MPVLEQPSDMLRQFCHGDLDAFETLFRRHQSEVYGWIVRIIRDPAAAEDLTVEAFWRIYRVHARFDPTRSFGAWAHRIATNAALDHLKTARRETDLPYELQSPPLPDPGISEARRRKTARVFSRLPPKLQVAATLALIEEQPYKEIADALGISTGAVKVRVFRALRFLRKESSIDRRDENWMAKSPDVRRALVPILPHWIPEPITLCALFSGPSRLTPKVRVLLDFLDEYLGTDRDRRLRNDLAKGYFTDRMLPQTSGP